MSTSRPIHRFTKGNTLGLRLGAVPEAFRCRATSKGTGKRCQCVAVKGMAVCRHHGGWRGKPATLSKLKRMAATLNGVRYPSTT